MTVEAAGLTAVAVKVSESPPVIATVSTPGCGGGDRVGQRVAVSVRELVADVIVRGDTNGDCGVSKVRATSNGRRVGRALPGVRPIALALQASGTART